jgi:RNA polymerase sigma factor (TIGR02999 family)
VAARVKTPDPQTITRLLRDAGEGRPQAVDDLLPLVYAELHGLSAALFSQERQGHTLQPTAVIHEAWMKLVGHLGQLEDRTHFFAIASRAMRQVLTDHARSARRLKRGGNARAVTLDEQFVEADGGGGVELDLVDLEDSLQRLSALNARHARMVELRVLGGLTIAETAAALEVSPATIERDWFQARAWLRRELGAP